jgi:hypothetical protein
MFEDHICTPYESLRREAFKSKKKRADPLDEPALARNT